MAYRGSWRSGRLPRSSSTRAAGSFEVLMKSLVDQTSYFRLQAFAVAVLASAALVTPVWADGYEFFTVDRGKPVNLVYVGQIREKDTGRVVREPAYFMVN